MKTVRVIVGLFLLPCCAAVSRTIYFIVTATGNYREAAWGSFWLAVGLGLFLWLLVFAFLPAPVKSYVLAHELTHVLWGSLTGATVLGMRVSGKGGNVRLSECNFIVVLSPYFFPFYTIIMVGVWFLASVFMDLQRCFPLLLGAIGFTLGFHICFTVSALGRRQPDIEQYGRFFSYALIYFMNLLVIGLLLVLVSPVSFSQFAVRLAADFKIVWGWLGQSFIDAIVAVKILLAGVG
ncbi:MAG: hypothetical protein Q7J98_05555 [Kiritimatiellia bacterium]|nr:hypothetical protein [Kiritimatiellia bacterium]